MSTRLQVLLDDAEFDAIRQVAEVRHQTVSDWVREALRAARSVYPTSDAGRKIQAVREAASHHYPTADIDPMLRQIESGYSGSDDE